jgi:ABC-type uncharacterized transport system permease subunit
MNIPLKYKSVAIRALKAFLSGALATMAVVMPFSGSSWKDVGVWIGALLMAGMVGGLTSLIMGYEKWLNWQE